MTLANWNAMSASEAAQAILPCCGSQAWAAKLAGMRPFAAFEDLSAASDAVWWGLPVEDWQQAFDSHPRIGQGHAKAATAKSLAWSGGEQATAANSMKGDDAARAALAFGNAAYEKKFGRIFIVCATGKSAGEMLGILEGRMKNDDATEMREAAEQQRLITQLRLRKWLQS